MSTTTTSPPNPHKRPHSPSSPQSISPPREITPRFHISHRITDRASSFLALFSPLTTSSSPTTTTVLTHLRAQPHLQGSMHRISASRAPSSQSTLVGAKQLYTTSTDDDGEKWASKRVLAVLEQEDVCGVCVVGRWWGGTMLGPVRFKYIEDVARAAVRKWKMQRGDGGGERGAKKVKLDEQDEGDESEKLRAQLETRDQSIAALRGLLAEKRALLAGHGDTEGREKVVGVSLGKMVVYEGVELERLRQLDKQRDATIGFLLRQIDEVERAVKDREKDVNGAEKSAQKSGDDMDEAGRAREKSADDVVETERSAQERVEDEKSP